MIPITEWSSHAFPDACKGIYVILHSLLLSIAELNFIYRSAQTGSVLLNPQPVNSSHETPPLQNKPNGQFHLPFDRKRIVAFMHDLPIRKVPGIGRVNERLLESIGIKVKAPLI